MPFGKRPDWMPAAMQMGTDDIAIAEVERVQLRSEECSLVAAISSATLPICSLGRRHAKTVLDDLEENVARLRPHGTVPAQVVEEHDQNAVPGVAGSLFVVAVVAAVESAADSFQDIGNQMVGSQLSSPIRLELGCLKDVSKYAISLMAGWKRTFLEQYPLKQGVLIPEHKALICRRTLALLQSGQ